MAAHAKLLVDVVKARRLSQRIGGKEPLLVEAWACLGSMLGVHAVVVWTRPNESGDGFLARVEARTLDGRIVGAAEAECSRAEPTWSKRAPYALRSMAQTRATSRALRAPLGALVTLAGYEPTGVEEMPAQETPRTAPSAVLEPAMTPQKQRIGELIRELERLEPGRDWKAHCREFVGARPSGCRSRSRRT